MVSNGGFQYVKIYKDIYKLSKFLWIPWRFDHGFILASGSSTAVAQVAPGKPGGQDLRDDLGDFMGNFAHFMGSKVTGGW